MANLKDTISRDAKEQARIGDGAAQPREIGSMKLKVTRYEYSPLYMDTDPGRANTIGDAFDDAISAFYKANVTSGALLTALSFEISDDAAFALRDRCNRGEY